MSICILVLTPACLNPADHMWIMLQCISIFAEASVGDERMVHPTKAGHLQHVCIHAWRVTKRLP